MPDSPGPEFPDGPDFPEFTEAELSSVVFDESFVRAARVHEPSADERGAAAEAVAAPPHTDRPDSSGRFDRADRSDSPGRPDRGKRADGGDADDRFDDGVHPDGEDPWYARTMPVHDSAPMLPHVPAWFAGEPWARAARAARWRRAVAWILAVLMGVGVVAIAVTAVYRSGAASGPARPSPSVGTGQSGPVDGGGTTLLPAPGRDAGKAPLRPVSPAGVPGPAARSPEGAAAGVPEMLSG